MSNMRCTRIQEKLTEYQFGLLEESERADVDAHLAACEPCRMELEALERLDALIEPVEQLEAPANLWSGVRQRVQPRRAPWWQLSGRPVGRAVAIAAATLLAVGGLWLGLRGGPAEMPQYELLASDVQEQQVVAQWSQPLADDAALGAIFASLNGVGEIQ